MEYIIFRSIFFYLVLRYDVKLQRLAKINAAENSASLSNFLSSLDQNYRALFSRTVQALKYEKATLRLDVSTIARKIALQN
jgi:hypothetical protein